VAALVDAVPARVRGLGGKPGAAGSMQRRRWAARLVAGLLREMCPADRDSLFRITRLSILVC